MKARLGGGKCSGEFGVVFAEVVRREEEVVEVGFDEPIAKRRPDVALGKGYNKAYFGNHARHR